MDQARGLQQLETENSRVKRAVTELTMDNQELKEATAGGPTTTLGNRTPPLSSSAARGT